MKLNPHQGQPRKWTTALRIESRYGATRYVIQFSDGHLRASLYGSVRPLATSPPALTEAAWQVAADWLAHLSPGTAGLQVGTSWNPKKEIRRIHFPVNRRRRKSRGFGGSKAA
jgi:hypothetical protein